MPKLDRDLTLMAIGEVHKRWTAIRDTLDSRGFALARREFRSSECSLCDLCFDRCLECPVCLEHKFDRTLGTYGQHCGTLLIVRVSIDGVLYSEHSKYKTLRAIGRLLKGLDWLQGRVEKSDNYEDKTSR